MTKLIRVDKRLSAQLGVTLVTLRTWIKTFTVDGEPLGAKVGGQWRFYAERLEKFLRNEGVKKIEKVA